MMKIVNRILRICWDSPKDSVHFSRVLSP
uniref:Uncharacterized protein n=1 Tax=Anguilla anguilla TaxID=7936 RepID=A0A0E9TYZ1_ANGAN